MCELMGNEPVEDEIPIEFEDFPWEVQQAFSVYNMLRDEWDSMSGLYLGKTLIGIKDILDAMEIEREEHKFMIILVRMIDRVRSDEINSKKANEKPANAS